MVRRYLFVILFVMSNVEVMKSFDLIPSISFDFTRNTFDEVYGTVFKTISENSRYESQLGWFRFEDFYFKKHLAIRNTLFKENKFYGLNLQFADHQDVFSLYDVDKRMEKFNEYTVSGIIGMSGKKKSFSKVFLLIELSRFDVKYVFDDHFYSGEQKIDTRNRYVLDDFVFRFGTGFQIGSDSGVNFKASFLVENSDNKESYDGIDYRDYYWGRNFSISIPFLRYFKLECYNKYLNADMDQGKYSIRVKGNAGQYHADNESSDSPLLRVKENIFFVKLTMRLKENIVVVFYPYLSGGYGYMLETDNDFFFNYGHIDPMSKTIWKIGVSYKIKDFEKFNFRRLVR